MCLPARCFTPMSRGSLADARPEKEGQQTIPLFQRMISNFHQPNMESLRCQYRLPSYGGGKNKTKHRQLNLLFVIQRNETITSVYGLITEINLGVDTENVDGREGRERGWRRGEGRGGKKRENRHQSQISLTSFPMHDSGSSSQMWESGAAAAAPLFKTPAQQRA